MILDYLCLFYYKAYVRKKVRRPWYFVDRLMEGTIFFTFAPLIKLGHVLFLESTSLKFKVILLLLCLGICNVVCEKLEARHRRNVQMLLDKYGDNFPNVPLIFCMLLSGIYMAHPIYSVASTTQIYQRNIIDYQKRCLPLPYEK